MNRTLARPAVPIGSKKFNVDEIIFIGRTLSEYLQMFDLDIEYLRHQRTLDCPAGPCSFVAEVHKRGIPAVAAEILYDLEPEVLKEKCREDIEKTMFAFSGTKDLFNWHFYLDVEGRRRKLVEASNKFLEDYPEGRREGRYVKVELPALPFRDGEFSLVLCANFLFLYGDRLDYDFHVKCLDEFMRVTSGELRVFPLLGLDTNRYRHLDEIIVHLRNRKHDVSVLKVPYEFQKGGDEMLRVRKDYRPKEESDEE